MNYYYIYIFFDPTDSNTVFYCGRGTGNRPKGHLNQAGFSIVSHPVKGDLLGASADDVAYVEELQFEEQQSEQQLNVVQLGALRLSKVQKIQELTKRKVSPAQMIRVIATGLSYGLSQTMESFCIHHVYGTEKLKTGTLLNLANGKGKDRFRPHGDWTFSEWVGAEVASHVAPYYTYVLRNPTSGVVEYVGKGKGDRCFSHFKDLDTLTPEEKTKKQNVLTSLLTLGHKEGDIVRLIAVGLNEEEALAIESFCIKYVFGPQTNAVMGHHPKRFRAQNDWDLRLGFDIPFLATANGVEARQLELDQWLGQGYPARLAEVVASYPVIQFSELFNHGAGSAAIAATVCGCNGEERGVVHVFAHSPITFAISIEIRWRGKAQMKSFRNKFRTFIAEEWEKIIPTIEDLDYINRRREMVFLPDPWRNNPTLELETAIKRLGWMIALLQTDTRKELSQKVGEDGISELLGVDEKLRADLEEMRINRNRTRNINRLRRFEPQATNEQCHAALEEANDDLERTKEILARWLSAP